MKRPAFQFYPADWRNNANLRRCSPAARGVWMDVLCVLHDSDEYGLVRWPLADLANAANAPLKLVQELVGKRVLKGGDADFIEQFVYVPRSGRKDGEPVILIPTQSGPLWYSSRMVKDEYVRTIRGESSRFGEPDGAAPKRPPKSAPKPTKGDGSSLALSPSGNSPQPPSGRGARVFNPEKRTPAEPLTVPNPEGNSTAEWLKKEAEHRASVEAERLARLKAKEAA